METSRQNLWAIKNRKKVNEYQKRWRKANQDKVKAQKQRYKEKMAKV